MSYSSSSAMGNDPTFSSVELVGGYSSTTLNWNNNSDLKISGGLLVRDNILSTGNVKIINDASISRQIVVFGTLNGTAGGNLVLVGDLTPIDSNVPGAICWDGLTVFGNASVTGKTTYYDDDAQLALMGNCLVDDNKDTSLCANEDDTISWRVADQAAATLQPNGAFKLGQTGAATGNWSFAEGWQTTVSGFAGHVEGNVNACSGDSSHVMGYNSTESGFANHVEGKNQTVSGSINHVEGELNDVSGIVNTILVMGGGVITGDYNHAESAGTVTIQSDTNHVETQCKVNSDQGLDHLESHGVDTTRDLQTIGGAGLNSGLNHSDSGNRELYMAGYCTKSAAGMRNLTKGQYGSVIGSDATCNQTGMTVISPGTVGASPFGQNSGSTFTSPTNASVGHGHAQLTLFHIRGLTNGATTGNLSLEYPTTPEVFPELKYYGTDTTVTNTDVLRQIWNVNMTVVGKDTVASGCWGQNVNFVAVHNTLGTAIEIANVSPGTVLSSGTLTGASVSVLSVDNTIRVEVTSSSLNPVHWAGTLRVVNSGVMDFTGDLVTNLI